jgi:hypothetical protein
VFLLLAECALHDRNLSRARRLTLAAQRMSKEHELPQSLAYCELILGWIDEADGLVDRALSRWARATAMAEKINSKRVAFTAEVEILRQATRRRRVRPRSSFEATPRAVGAVVPVTSRV